MDALLRTLQAFQILLGCMSWSFLHAASIFGCQRRCIERGVYDRAILAHFAPVAQRTEPAPPKRVVPVRFRPGAPWGFSSTAEQAAHNRLVAGSNPVAPTRTLKSEYPAARQPERRPRMVKVTIEADTPDELAEAARKLAEPPAIKLDLRDFPKTVAHSIPQNGANGDTGRES